MKEYEINQLALIICQRPHPSNREGYCSRKINFDIASKNLIAADFQQGLLG